MIGASDGRQPMGGSGWDGLMTDTASPLTGREISRIDANDLLLDDSNPRFGMQHAGRGQVKLLDHIVATFGIDDVLSSLAVNGYFEAEPLVCRRQPDASTFVVVEGNRRLAACLILLEDERARNQPRRKAEYVASWRTHRMPPINPIPALVFDADEQQEAMLAYLGVRHIRSAKAWDSYAKAAWVAKVIEADRLTVKQVAEVIGDRHGTVNRMLEGYYLVDQLTKSGHFRPEDSIRKGRASVTAYPFSWVYTILGYTTVREFLELGEDDAHRDPIPATQLENAGTLMTSMFGDRSRGQSSAIEDSRQLGALASAFATTDKVRLLEQGKSLSEIEVLTQPIERRLAEGLATIRDELRDLIGRLSEQRISEEAADAVLPASGRNRRSAVELDRKLRDIAAGGDDDG